MVTKQTTVDTIFPFAAAFATFVLVLVLIMQVTNLGKMVYSDKVQLAQTSFDLTRLDSVLANEKAHNSEIASVVKTIPNGYQEVAFVLGALEALAKNHSLTLDLKLDDKAVEETGDIHSVLVTLDMTGSYANTQVFLTDISRMPYHTQVSELLTDNVHTSVKIKLFIK